MSCQAVHPSKLLALQAPPHTHIHSGESSEEVYVLRVQFVSCAAGCAPHATNVLTNTQTDILPPPHTHQARPLHNALLAPVRHGHGQLRELHEHLSHLIATLLWTGGGRGGGAESAQRGLGWGRKDDRGKGRFGVSRAQHQPQTGGAAGSNISQGLAVSGAGSNRAAAHVVSAARRGVGGGGEVFVQVQVAAADSPHTRRR